MNDFKKTIDNLRNLAEHIDGIDGYLFMSDFFYDYNPHKAFKLEGEKVVRNWCGTAACALGWSTTCKKMPPKPEHFGYGGIFSINTYGFYHYPALYEQITGDTNRDWKDVFGWNLSNDKRDCIKRLLDKADELERAYLAYELEKSI